MFWLELRIFQPNGIYLSTTRPRPFMGLEWHKEKKHRPRRHLSLPLKGQLVTSQSQSSAYCRQTPFNAASLSPYTAALFLLRAMLESAAVAEPIAMSGLCVNPLASEESPERSEKSARSR